MKQYINKMTAVILLAFCLYSFFSIVLYSSRNILSLESVVFEKSLRFMPWNLFLAFLPLLFSNLLRLCVKFEHKTGAIISGVFWLIFFPNAPYVITDIIHLSNYKYHASGYVRELAPWISLLYIISGVIIGTLMGLMSLRIIHGEIIRIKGKRIAGCAVVGIAVISGYAVYIGRFLRFNSWDILRPIDLLMKIVDKSDLFSVIFTLSMTLYILFTYRIFCLLKEGSLHE